MNFIAELKRRNVLRAAGLYLVGSWLTVQVASTILPMFGAASWVVRGVVIALAIGFLPAMVVAWVFELTPDGLKRDEEVKPEESIAPQTGQRMDRWLLVVSVVAIAYFAFDKFVLAPQREAALVTQTAAHVTAEISAEKAKVNSKSIAVLAFTDLSPAHDQGYFSDGMSEEILNALTQIKDLKVAGRTSSFYYKNRNEDLRSIGKALGVANVLEGSVRKQDNKVRITAQMIRTQDGFHLWSHDYDGDLSNVFELQDHIARDITDALKPVLEGDQARHLVPVLTTSPEAYTLYLQATDALNKRDYPRMGQAIGWLQQAIRLDPNFARAHSRLALIHVLGKAQFGASDSEAQRQANLAIALDPSLAESQVALAIVARKDRQPLAARTAMDRAVALEPDDAGVNLYYAQALIDEGCTRQGVARLDRTLTIDPMLPNALYWRGFQFLFAGDQTAAEREFMRARDLGLSFADNGFAALARSRGDYPKARELVLPFILDNPENMACLNGSLASVRVFLDGSIGGDAPARAKALTLLDACLAAKPAILPVMVPQGLMRMGLPARALEAIARGPVSDEAGMFISMWGPDGRETRRLPGFAAFLRQSGFADLWDRYGAPDPCRKAAAGDYVCE
jgi:TolB-like protein/Flp pilus assembly protein TadD